jgi:DNA-binding transcriptional ArsR family regulator
MAGKLRLDDVLWTRIQKLDEAARRILECVAVAGAPLGQDCAAQASGVAQPAFSRHLAILRVGQLVRTTHVRQREALEAYHDRIREAVLAKLSADERRARHLEVARALVATGADPEPIALHFRAADEPASAAEYTVQAAQRASAALAFGRAATLYQQAVELRTQLGEDPRALEIVMGDALTHAGRGAEAARAYLHAARDAPPAEALDLHRRAAQQLLVTGHIDAGIEALRAVIGSEGLMLPESPRRAVLSILLDRVRLLLRGMGFRRRDQSEVPHRELARIDVCWHAGCGLGMADRIKGVVFQARGLLLALRAGEAHRIVRTMAVHAVTIAGEGASARRRVEKMLLTAERLAQELRDPYATALTAGARGACDFLLGRFRSGAELCTSAEVGFREHCTGVSWELATMRLWTARALQYLGDFQRLGRWLPLVLQECRDRGDLYGATSVRASVMPFVWLARDDVMHAREEVDEALLQWSPSGFHIQHYYAVVSWSSIALYAGDLEAARDELSAKWPRIKAAMLLRVSPIRAALHDLRGRIQLALAARDSRTRAESLREVELHARALERERLPWTGALATSLRAGVAHLRSERDACEALLVRAARAFDEADMALHAACMRRALGMLGSDEPAQLTRLGAEHAIRALGVIHVEKMATLLAPAFTTSTS